MESIECKNCGSSEIIKGAGFYFCRSCGTRYSIEEVEGTQVERIALLQSNDNTIRKTAHLIPQEDVFLKIAFIDYLINVDDVPQDIFSSLIDVKVEKSYVPVYLLGVNWNANWNATFSHQESHQEQEYDYNGRVKGSRTVYETINRSANGSCGGFAAAAVSANGSQNRTIFRSQSQVFKGELKDSLPHIDDYPNESFEFRKPNDSEIMDTIYPSIWGEVRGNASNMGHYNESMSACDFHISSVSIDSIDLVYVPFWHLWYYYNNKKYEASINAGNGFVHTTPPTEDNTQLSQKRSELKEREGRMWMWWTIAGVLLGLVILSLCCSWRSTIYWVIATIASIALLLVQININKRLKAEIKRLQQEGIVERKNSAYAVFGEKLNNIGVTMRLNGEISNSSSHLAHEKSEERVAEHSECNNTAETQPAVETQSTLSNQAKASSVEESDNHRITWLIIILLLVGVAVGGIVYYSDIYLPQKRDAEAPRYYTFANSVRMRSSAEFDVEYNKLESFGYGTEVIVYDSMPGNYFYGKVAPKDARGKVIKDRVVEGYMAYAYLLPQEDFFRMNGIFGNSEAMEMLDESRYRRALLDYLKSHNYCGKITVEQIAEHNMDPDLNNAEQWQVFCKDKTSRSNTVYRSRKYNRHSKYTDLAVIIQNVRSGERRLLYFIFDDETGTPELRGEQAAPAQGYMVDGTLTLQDWGHDGVDVYVRYTD